MLVIFLPDDGYALRTYRKLIYLVTRAIDDGSVTA